MQSTLSLLAVAVLLAGGVAGAKPKKGACSRTADAARKACGHEAKDDLWIANGLCYNLADESARGRCLDAAKAAAREAESECKDQLEAREDLCEALGEAPYDPVIDAARFRSPAETAANPNPYLPLVPGTTRVYRGPGETVTVTVTSMTKVILGVTTMVVRDVVANDQGEVVEDTDDWFAQDADGNVWYFGEISRNYENGELVDIEGSWTAGVDGARAGIVMKATPTVGDVYRQEFALGDAEDAGEVTSTTGSASVPGASCNGTCVVTRDFTPLEPDAEESKYYAPGTGLILEVDGETGKRVELISVTKE
jgi:hypothetical protein